MKAICLFWIRYCIFVSGHASTIFVLVMANRNVLEKMSHPWIEFWKKFSKYKEMIRACSSLKYYGTYIEIGCWRKLSYSHNSLCDLVAKMLTALKLYLCYFTTFALYNSWQATNTHKWGFELLLCTPLRVPMFTEARGPNHRHSIFSKAKNFYHMWVPSCRKKSLDYTWKLLGKQIKKKR